jgi:hypothetical protein
VRSISTGDEAPAALHSRIKISILGPEAPAALHSSIKISILGPKPLGSGFTVKTRKTGWNLNFENEISETGQNSLSVSNTGKPVSITGTETGNRPIAYD